MKKLLVLTLACALFMSGCASTNTTTPSSNSTGAVVQNVITNGLPVIRPVICGVCMVTLNLAISGQDRIDKAIIINSISSAVASLSGGTCPTADQVQAAIVSVAPNTPGHWSTLATSVGGIYASLYTQYIKGDVKLAAQVLEQISLGCKDATTPLIPVPVTPTPISQ